MGFNSGFKGLKCICVLWTLVTSNNSFYLCLVWTLYNLVFRLATKQKRDKWRPAERHDCSDRLVYLTVHKFWAQNLHGHKKPLLKLSRSKLYSCVYYIENYCYVSHICWPLLHIINNSSINHKIPNFSSPRKTVREICRASLMKIKKCKQKLRPYSVQL